MSEELDVIPRLMNLRDIMLLYGMDHVTVQKHLKNGTLRSIKGSGGERMIYDPAWQFSFGVGMTNTEHLHIFTGTEVCALLNINLRTLNWYASRRVIGFKIVGKRRCYSLYNIRQALGWRERNPLNKRGPKVREWLMKWAATKLLELPENPLVKEWATNQWNRKLVTGKDLALAGIPTATLPPEGRR